ncbi:hypothetical protein ACSAZL_07930 [Methanosarcina sp. T3]
MNATHTFTTPGNYTVGLTMFYPKIISLF